MEVPSAPRVLFTAPWDPIPVRRGDALGLRAFADRLADAIAPDLSNRVRDGRWVTILSWCLCRSHAVYYRSGNRHVESRALQRERYAWLRPLELMWVARTIEVTEEDWRKRQLAGQRRVLPWLNGERKGARFGMSSDQFRAYRQTGLYGAYRLVFRRWPKMTRGGDGWTPDESCNQLAEWMDGKLGAARPSFGLHVSESADDDVPASKWSLWRERQDAWWLERWPEFDTGARNAEPNTLPRPRDEYAVLPESALLSPIVFGADAHGVRRSSTAALAYASKAGDHQSLCEYLAAKRSSDPAFQVLPLFARMADAGMHVMDLVSDAVRDTAQLRASEVASSPQVKEACAALTAAAQAWKQRPGVTLRHIESADRFAGAVLDGGAARCLTSVLQYHERFGGGLRWFVVRDGVVVPRSTPHAGSSRYRFRLWSLCRLAAQCGKIKTMPPSLLLDGAEDEEDDDE